MLLPLLLLALLVDETASDLAGHRAAADVVDQDFAVEAVGQLVNARCQPLGDESRQRDQVGLGGGLGVGVCSFIGFVLLRFFLSKVR
jgi:hypothetical protein